MAKKMYIVGCTRHGSDSKDWAGKQIRVPQPTKGKKEKYGLGCPRCRAEAAVEKQTSS